MSSDPFAPWVALLARLRRLRATPRYTGVTAAASQLLEAVDAGGVPAFVTNRLRQIALDNGIAVKSEWTPNDVVAAIRDKATPRENPVDPAGPGTQP